MLVVGVGLHILVVESAHVGAIRQVGAGMVGIKVKVGGDGVEKCAVTPN